MSTRMVPALPSNTKVIVEKVQRGTTVHDTNHGCVVFDPNLLVTLAQAVTWLRADFCPRCFPGGSPW